MQAISPRPSPLFNGRFARNLRYLLLTPITAFVVMALIFAVGVSLYRARHDGRIYTGVTVLGVDLSRMTPDEAQTALAQAIPYPQETAITFTHAPNGQTWQKSPAELGLSFDVRATTAAALDFGRHGAPSTRLRDMFQSWYYSRSLSPILKLDQARLENGLADVAAQFNQPAVSAALTVNGGTAVYTPGQVGRALDTAAIGDLLVQPLTDLRQAQIELRLRETMPAIYDDPATADRIRQTISSPITFYLREPLTDVDLGRVELSREELAQWLRFELIPGSKRCQPTPAFCGRKCGPSMAGPIRRPDRPRADERPLLF